MAFSVADKHGIKCLRQTKGYNAKQLLKMFPEKQWTVGGLSYLMRKIVILSAITIASLVAVDRDAHALTMLLMKLRIWY